VLWYEIKLEQDGVKIRMEDNAVLVYRMQRTNVSIEHIRRVDYHVYLEGAWRGCTCSVLDFDSKSTLESKAT
jgi:hypothetical protein